LLLGIIEHTFRLHRPRKTRYRRFQEPKTRPEGPHGRYIYFSSMNSFKHLHGESNDQKQKDGMSRRHDQCCTTRKQAFLLSQYRFANGFDGFPFSRKSSKSTPASILCYRTSPCPFSRKSSYGTAFRRKSSNP